MICVQTQTTVIEDYGIHTYPHTHIRICICIYIMCTNWYSEHKKHYEFCPEMMDDSPNVFPTTADVLSLSRWYTLVCFMVGHFGHWWHQTPEVFGLWPGLMCLRRNSHQQPAVGSDFIRFPIFQIFQVPKNISFVSWRIHAHPSMAFHGIPWHSMAGQPLLVNCTSEMGADWFSPTDRPAAAAGRKFDHSPWMVITFPCWVKTLRHIRAHYYTIFGMNILRDNNH